ncbi:MAG: hypothetical protein AAF702_35280 [Chloroflexota bacterium]
MSEQPFQLQAPENSVICVVANESDVNKLKSVLSERGYNGEDSVSIGHGEEWLKIVDPDGSYHSGMARLIRTFQRLTTEVDDRTLGAVEGALTSGKYLVLVSTDGSEAQRDQIHELMQQYNGTHVFFAGRRFTQLLSGW